MRYPIHTQNVFSFKADVTTPCVDLHGPTFLRLADRCHSLTKVATAALRKVKRNTAKLTSQHSI
jgi:hypothetical protein